MTTSLHISKFAYIYMQVGQSSAQHTTHSSQQCPLSLYTKVPRKETPPSPRPLDPTSSRMTKSGSRSLLPVFAVPVRTSPEVLADNRLALCSCRHGTRSRRCRYRRGARSPCQGTQGRRPSRLGIHARRMWSLQRLPRGMEHILCRAKVVRLRQPRPGKFLGRRHLEGGIPIQASR